MAGPRDSLYIVFVQESTSYTSVVIFARFESLHFTERNDCSLFFSSVFVVSQVKVVVHLRLSAFLNDKLHEVSHACLSSVEPPILLLMLRHIDPMRGQRHLIHISEENSLFFDLGDVVHHVPIKPSLYLHEYVVQDYRLQYDNCITNLLARCIV
jgi:hypothetical protein